MIHAYQEIYLDNIQSLLGEAFNYAINTCDIDGDDFIKLFTASSSSKKIENGECSYSCGKSGLELVQDILRETTSSKDFPNEKDSFSRTSEYWIGYVVAYYQWYSNRSFADIFYLYSYEDLSTMYITLHEADISKFVDIVDKKMKETFYETNLKRIRKLYGISQSTLANYSKVSLRSIQMYEQRNKDINKASGETLYRLAKILGCSMEDLLEK